MPIPCLFHNQPFHTCHMPRSCWTSPSQTINHFSHTYSPNSCFTRLLNPNIWQTSKYGGKTKLNTCSPYFSLRLKGLTQARGFPRSGELPSPSRELEEWEQWLAAISHLGEPSSLERDYTSLKTKIWCLSDNSNKKLGRAFVSLA